MCAFSSPAQRAASAAPSPPASRPTERGCWQSTSRPDSEGPGEHFEADLTTREGNRAAVDRALESFGGLDVVVANAGMQHVAPVAEFGEDDWDRLIALLLTSPFLLAKYAWGALVESREARFIAVASVHGLVASPYKAGYVSAKHGVLGLVKTLALEGAEDGRPRHGALPGRSCARRSWSPSLQTRRRRTGSTRSGCSRTSCWPRTRSSA